MNKIIPYVKKLSLKYPLLFILINRFYKFGTIKNSISKKIKGKNNSITYSKVILNKVIFDIKGNSNSITIKEGSILDGLKFYIRGDNHTLIIDEECIFNKGGSIWFEHNNGFLHIGEKSTIDGAHIAITEPFSKVIIGEDCMFASGTEIRTGDSHSIIDLNTNNRINYARDIKIGNHVWLASHCCILKGVEIEDGSIVAIGSIVTKGENEKNIILAGNPAKIVKRNVTWDRKNIL